MPFLYKEALLIIRCERCTTTYHLDQKFVEPFGSKVRCTRCGHIFWVEPTAFSETPPRLESVPELGPSMVLEDEKETVVPAKAAV